MANLFFPQLTSGALAQYPIQKRRAVRTVKNVLPDGSMITYSDPFGGRVLWELKYTELSGPDVQLLQSHFDACSGALRAFTFIDPTENMINRSADLTSSAWQNPSGIVIASGASDPEGGAAAFTITNAGQTNGAISQSFPVPANYQYCFSICARSATAATVMLARQAESTSESTTYEIGPEWQRLVSNGRLEDGGTSFTVAVVLIAGQQVQVFGPQLEPQIEPSRYRPTSGGGGVYAGAHWAVDQLAVAADAPDLFSTVFSIETAA